MKTQILALLASFVFASSGFAMERVWIEPGPENGGLRLRLIISPKPGKEGFLSQIELLNTTKSDIKVRADWEQETEKGGLKEYLEAATSIETWPPFAPWMGQTGVAHRNSPQPEETIKAGGELSVSWQTDGRRLKNKVSNPLDVQDPELTQPGLYSVHAVLVVKTATGDFLLRSNEQLVRVGGSGVTPKHTFARLNDVDPKEKTARLDIGSLHKVAVGDQFEVGYPFTGYWKITITTVGPDYAAGTVEAVQLQKDRQTFPDKHMQAVLVEKKKTAAAGNPGAEARPLRFVPNGGPWKGEAPFDGAAWTKLNPGLEKGVLMLHARAGVGDKFPVREKEGAPLFEVKLVEGDDTHLVLEVQAKEGVQKVELTRDKQVSVEVAGVKYALNYPTLRVTAEADEKPSTNKATVMVTRRE